jgi:hypothetical protein
MDGRERFDSNRDSNPGDQLAQPSVRQAPDYRVRKEHQHPRHGLVADEIVEVKEGSYFLAPH